MIYIIYIIYIGIWEYKVFSELSFFAHLRSKLT